MILSKCRQTRSKIYTIMILPFNIYIQTYNHITLHFNEYMSLLEEEEEDKLNGV